MSIQNINFLQSDNDTAYIPNITSYTAATIYQSLANSGQRYGAKGDSIGISYFTLNEITGIEDDTNNGVIGDVNQKSGIVEPNPGIVEQNPGIPAPQSISVDSDTEKPPFTSIKDSIITDVTIDNIGGLSVAEIDSILSADLSAADAPNNFYVFYDDKNSRLILRTKSTNFIINDLESYNPLESVFYQIILALYKDLKKSDKDKVIIPGNYKFYYYYNTNDDSEVWSSSEYIIVNYISDTKEQIKNSVCIISDTKYNYTNIYKFSVSYDSNKKPSILVSKVYALPYIDDNHYWVVNDIETGIYASGDYTGQPNIMIISTVADGAENTSNVLNIPSLSDNINETRVEWTQTECNIAVTSKIEKNDTSDKYETTTDIVTVNTYVPVIKEINTNDDLLSLYKNSLLINIINDIKINNDKTCTVSTLWKFDNNEKSETYAEFVPIINYNYKPVAGQTTDTATKDIILTMSDLSGINDTFSRFTESFTVTHPIPDTSYFRSLAFSKINTIPKNSTQTAGDNNTYGFLFRQADSNSDTPTNDLTLKLYCTPYKYDENNGYIPVSLDDKLLDFNNQINISDTNLTYVKSFSNVPLIDLSEVFIDGVSIMDTQSVVALTDKQYAYTASFGFNSESLDKNTVFLSSNAYIPKIGKYNLAKNTHGTRLKGPDNLKIDFNNTIFNGLQWNEITSEIYTTIITPVYTDTESARIDIGFNVKGKDDKIYNQAIYYGPLNDYNTQKTIFVYNVYDVHEKSINTNINNITDKTYLGQTRLLNINKFIKDKLGIDIVNGGEINKLPANYYWLELNQYGLCDDTNLSVYNNGDDIAWLGNKINVTYSLYKTTDMLGNPILCINKIILEEQYSNNNWNSNSTVYLKMEDDQTKPGMVQKQINTLIRVGNRVVIDVKDSHISPVIVPQNIKPQDNSNLYKSDDSLINKPIIGDAGNASTGDINSGVASQENNASEVTIVTNN